MSIRLDPATFSKAIIVEAADIPAHMTIAQWREHRRPEQRERRRGGRRWLRRRVRRPAVA
jgi:hypothetical protein